MKSTKLAQSVKVNWRGQVVIKNLDEYHLLLIRARRSGYKRGLAENVAIAQKKRTVKKISL